MQRLCKVYDNKLERYSLYNIIKITFKSNHTLHLFLQSSRRNGTSPVYLIIQAHASTVNYNGHNAVSTRYISKNLKLITIADMFRESIITNKNPHKLVNSNQSILYDCFTLFFVLS